MIESTEQISPTAIGLDPEKLNIGIFLFPGMTMLDAYGPLQVLAVSRLFNTFTFAKSAEPLPCDANVALLPNYGFSDCPPLDVLIVPGGANPIAQIEDEQVISFLSAAGEQAKYVTSVCTGALILAETGLLDGYKSTVHWAYVESLKRYKEVSYVNQRIVKDRNRISGGGITAGLDFALTLIAEITGEQHGKTMELLLEYDPEPPFHTGNHNLVGEKLKQQVQGMVHHIAKELFLPLPE
ncbi:DJ-1/PfpI family protein [Shewanella atlantica]|uniref:DJ-1/PfpI family protein n=1 Tax=Shewanella atlantica TaxID=271099 RepID=A0A3S0JR48_9GAMM|nr:DJ-1/PfpI family protein [Shewanella atlantica]RTR27202.1 DJ-1/PfpI family protein [Shewanella atlantica]